VNKAQSPATHFLVGGGIASLAAAVFLVRDAGVRGADIVVLEKESRFGGSLDGSGGPETGYLVRGGRMFEEHFACTFDLLSSIPAINPEHGSITEEIKAFNREVRGSSRCRLVRGGQKVEPSLGLSMRDMRDLALLVATPERLLAGRTIESCFTPKFFETNFWLMWSTMFAFQTWHSAVEARRYFRRFVHLFPGFKRLEGVLRTRYNQYDSIVAPVSAWLAAKGVRFEKEARVIDVELEHEGSQLRISALRLTRKGQAELVPVAVCDRVYLTLGSMTDGSSVGSNTTVPPPAADRGAWDLWMRLASREPVFGRPAVFCNDVSRTRWESFTVTLPHPAFFDFMETFTGNVTGTGGLVTFIDSGWMLSIAMIHQPHFVNQAAGTYVFWGYGLRGDRQGDFVKKPMDSCCGDEILRELAGHLRLGDRAAAMFNGAKVIPCMMPFITSQFMPRRPGDRPKVVPAGAQNFAILGQFCEMPRDVVFTVEYSVRSDMTAVNILTGRGRPPVRRTDLNPTVQWRAVRTLMAG
jgi:oleate hydratase